MDIQQMLEKLNVDRNSPFFEIFNYIDTNQVSLAVDCIKQYFECDDNTAKVVFLNFKEKYYDTYKKEQEQYVSTLSPQQIAHNNAVAREWQNKPKCMYCGSTNIKKISAISKVGSVALFGVFALGKTSKQWHCNNCKSDF